MVLALETEGARAVSVALKYFSRGLDQSTNPLFILEKRLNLLHANAAGHNLLRTKILCLEERRLVTNRRAENVILQIALLKASDSPGFTRFCDREGRSIMLLAIQLLQIASDLSVILVRAIDLRIMPNIGNADICRLFGLSPAEGRVAASLLSGNDPGAIAKILDLSAETVRTHLKQAMIKTATHSQAQLIGVLSRGTQAVLPI